MWSNIAILTCPNCGCASVGVAKDGQCLCENCGTTFNIIETQTNEEWFCSLSTEEKAEWLSKRSEYYYASGTNHFAPKIMSKEDWNKWLKQPHTKEER